MYRYNTQGLSSRLLSSTPSMSSPFYAEGGKTYLAESICRRHTNEVICSACPPSIQRIFSSGFNLDSAGKKARSGLPRRAFACKRCGRRLTVTRYLSLAFGVLDTASISTCIALVLRDHSGDSTTQRTLSSLLSRLANVKPTKALESLESLESPDTLATSSTLPTSNTVATSETLETIDTPSVLTTGRSTSSGRASIARRLPLIPIDNSAYLTPTHSTSKKRLCIEGESDREHSTLTTTSYKRPRLQIQDRPSRPPLTLPSVSIPPLTLPSVSIPPLTLPSVSIPPLTLPSVSIPPATLVRLPSQLSDDLTKVFSALGELSTSLVGYFPASSPEKDCSLSPTLEVASDTTILYSPTTDPPSHEAPSSPISEPAFNDPPSSRVKRASFLSSPSLAPKSEPSLPVEGERLVLPEPRSVLFPLADPTITTTLTTSTPSDPLQAATLLATTELSEASASIVSDLLDRFERARDPRERGAIWKEVRCLKLTSAFTSARAERGRDGRDGETNDEMSEETT
jgi:hypothetical protein